MHAVAYVGFLFGGGGLTIYYLLLEQSLIVVSVSHFFNSIVNDTQTIVHMHTSHISILQKPSIAPDSAFSFY